MRVWLSSSAGHEKELTAEASVFPVPRMCLLTVLHEPPRRPGSQSMLWLYCFNYYFFCDNSEGNKHQVIPVKWFKKFGQKPKQDVGFPVPGFGLAQLITFYILEGRGNKQHGFCNSEVEKSIFSTLCACSMEPNLWD